ncbi:hypothetical protein EL75_4662 [Escherichia coli]|nr:hypothetical protein EL75_4662 [Escherichia coli]
MLTTLSFQRLRGSVSRCTPGNLLLLHNQIQQTTFGLTVAACQHKGLCSQTSGISARIICQWSEGRAAIDKYTAGMLAQS